MKFLSKKTLFLSIFAIFFIILSSFLLISCGQQTIPIEEFSFVQSSISLFKGESYQLKYNYFPENAQNFVFIWSSSDSKIVSVEKGGYVTANDYGSAVITLQVKDSDIKATCNILVNDGDICTFTIDTSNVKMIYYEGQTFDSTGLKVYGEYESGKKVLLDESQYTIEYPAILNEDTEIKICYKNFKPKSFNILVFEDYVISIELSKKPTKTDYYIGDTFDKSGMEITAYYISGKTEIINDYQIASSTIEVYQTSVEILYNDLSIICPITSKAEIVVDSIQSLQDALSSGKESIMIRNGQYTTTSQIEISNANVLIFGESENGVTINGYNTTLINIFGENENLTLINLNLNAIGDNPSDKIIDLSACESGHITLKNISFNLSQEEAISIPQNPQFTLKVENN